MARPTVEALDDAREATVGLLLPLAPGRWLRLAVLAFLVGGGGGLSTLQGTGEVPAGGGPPGAGVDLPPLPDVGVPGSASILAVAAVLVAVALLLGLAYAVAGAVAEFVLVVAVRDGDPRLRAPASAHLGRGIRLFAFRLAVWVAVAALVAVPVALVLAGAVALSPAVLLLAVPLVLLVGTVAVVAWAVLRLTTDFAVPTMLVAGVGPLAAWRRLLPVLRADPVEAGLYLLVRGALGVAAAVATGLVAGLAAFVVAIPFAVAGLVAYLLLGPALGAVGYAVLGLLAATYALLALTLWLLVQVPVVVYLRAFALAALGHLDPALDVLGVSSEAGSAADDDDGNRNESASADGP